jgi:hypothetical protein
MTELSNFTACLKECVQPYTFEKSQKLMEERLYGKDLNAFGFVNTIEMIKYDIRRGVDGFTGEKFQSSQISLMNFEIENLAERLRGKEFRAEVKTILDMLGNL